MKLIPLSQDKFAMVDDADYEFLSKQRWCYARGRAVRGISLGGKKAKTIFMHRELCETGPRLQVRHIDGNLLNNQRHNLQAVESGSLRRNVAKANATGYRGVHPMHQSKRFFAKISYQGVVEYLGTFATALDAARAYDRKLLEYVGPHATLNVRDDEHPEFNAGVTREFTDTDSQAIPSNIQPPHPGDGPKGHGQNDLCGERVDQSWRQADR